MVTEPIPDNASGPEDWPYRLGKKAATPGAISFSLMSYVRADLLPKPPPYFKHTCPPCWHSYDNEKWGNCVWAGAANETSLWEHEAGLPVPEFTVKEVNADYAAVTGFDPKDPSTDQGTDMPKAASYRRNTGILDAKGNRHKIDAYALIKLKSMAHLKAAMWVLGGVGLGFKFPKYGMEQFSKGQPWSTKYGWLKGWLKDEISGGHYVSAIGIAKNGNIIVVSWGKEQEMTPDFYLRYADEVIGFLDLERMKNQLSPEGFDEQKLRVHLREVAEGRVYAQLGRGPTIA